ncbi:MAG TPA: thioredoxin [bacterium]|nr:thioredoxin [bacterium]
MQDLTAENFDQEVKQSDIPVIVDLWAPWCMPCKKLTPLLGKIEPDYEGKVKFVKVNIQDHQSVAQEFGVRSIPTMLFFKDGEVDSKLIGLQAEKKIRKTLDSLV